jgi:hypothetical protein
MMGTRAGGFKIFDPAAFDLSNQMSSTTATTHRAAIAPSLH